MNSFIYHIRCTPTGQPKFFYLSKFSLYYSSIFLTWFSAGKCPSSIEKHKIFYQDRNCNKHQKHLIQSPFLNRLKNGVRYSNSSPLKQLLLIASSWSRFDRESMFFFSGKEKLFNLISNLVCFIFIFLVFKKIKSNAKPHKKTYQNCFNYI